MSPFVILPSMNLSSADKLDLFFLIIGLKEVTRIDMFEGMDDPATVKFTLLRMGLFFETMPTSGVPSHRCGLAVAKNRDSAKDFKLAAEAGDYVKLKKLLGYQAVFPITKECVRVNQLKEKSPGLYNQLVERKEIAA